MWWEYDPVVQPRGSFLGCGAAPVVYFAKSHLRESRDASGLPTEYCSLLSSCRCWLISNMLFAHCPRRWCTSPAGLQPSGAVWSFHGKIVLWCGESGPGGVGPQVNRRPLPAHLCFKPPSVPERIAGCSSKNTFQWCKSKSFARWPAHRMLA